MLELIIAAGLLGTGIAACCGGSKESESSDSSDSSSERVDWSYSTHGDHDSSSSGGDRQSTLSEF